MFTYHDTNCLQQLNETETMRVLCLTGQKERGIYGILEKPPHDFIINNDQPTN